MYTGTIDHTQLRSHIGPEIDHVDQYMIIERFQKLTSDWNMLPAVTPSDINRVYRMYAAIKGLAMEGHHDALTLKCQYELS